MQIGEDEPVTRQPGETITLTVNARVTAVWETVSFGTPDLTLPGTLTVIEESAFEGDTAITSVDVPASCTFIGDYAFRGCTSLTMIRIPADCALGTGVFDGCEQVYIFGVAGSPAESYCGSHDNCLLVEEE